MIEIVAAGRLGNHLFLYAFGYSVAKDLNTEFRFRCAYRMNLDSVFDISNKLPLDSKFGKLSKWYERVVNRFFRPKRKLVKVEDFGTFVPEDNVWYKGYFQSYDFFKSHEAEIRNEFTFYRKHLDRFDSKFGKLFAVNEVLVVHIRRGDYLAVDYDLLGSKGLQLPMDYYHENIPKLVSPTTKVLFVSDDIEYVRKEFGEKPNYVFSGADMITDLIAMTRADKLIIANSSFSWWGAFLNDNPSKKVVGPKFYLGFKVNLEYPKGIMYEGFDWVDVPVS